MSSASPASPASSSSTSTALLEAAPALEDAIGTSRRSSAAVATPESPRDPRPSPATAPAAAGIAGLAGIGDPLALSTIVPSDPSTTHEKLSLNRLVERWGEVIDVVRGDGRGFLAAALEHALPSAITGRGDITLELDAAGSIYQQPIADSATDVLSAIGTIFTGASRLRTLAPERPVESESTPRRLTEEGVRSERLSMLRKRDPVLDLAVEALDLELLD